MTQLDKNGSQNILCDVSKKKKRKRKYPKIYNYKQKFYFCPENQFKKY